jgi:hypothetical protein
MYLPNIHFHFTEKKVEEGCHHSSCTENNNLKNKTLNLRPINQIFETRNYNKKPCNQVIARYAPSKDGELFENASHVVQQDMTA